MKYVYPGLLTCDSLTTCFFCLYHLEGQLVLSFWYDVVDDDSGFMTSYDSFASGEKVLTT